MKNFRTLNLVSLGILLAVNGLANALPLNGQNTASVSAKYPSLFTPAGYVFSIWGLIYIALIGFAVFPFLTGVPRITRLERVGGWFTAANLINAAWLFAWHWEILGLSVFLMAGLLASLIIIYIKLEIGLHGRVNPIEQWLIDFPISLYLGWICVATVANISAALVGAGWNGFGIAPAVWTILMITVVTLLGLLMIGRRNAITLPAVLVWALIGIRMQPGQNASVGLAAGLAAFVLLVFLMFRLLKARQQAFLAARGNRPTD